MHCPYKMPTAGDIRILEDSNDSEVQSDVASSHGLRFLYCAHIQP